MPVSLYYTQKVRGFQQEQVKYSSKSVEIHLKRTKHQCPYCGSTAVTVEPLGSCLVTSYSGEFREILFYITFGCID